MTARCYIGAGQGDESEKTYRSRSQAAHRAIIQRIADEGQLADGWTVDPAADLFYTVTMQGPWRELTRELGWTPEQYTENMLRLFRRSLLAE